MTLQEWIDRLGGCRKRHGEDYILNCPVCDAGKTRGDGHLYLRENTDGSVMMYCQKCKRNGSAICRELGVEERELFPPKTDAAPERRQARKSAEPVVHEAKETGATRVYADCREAVSFSGKYICEYPYTDADGKILFWSVRLWDKDKAYTEKTFRQCSPANGDGKYPVVLKVPNHVKHVLYCLPDVNRAIRQKQPVFVVEGEKDADTLRALGFCATTCSMGASKWSDECSKQLAHAHVYLLGDNDEAGRRDIETKKESLEGYVASLHVCDIVAEMPELPEKGDITDALETLGQGDRRAFVDRLMLHAAEGDIEHGKAIRLYNEVLPGFGARGDCIVSKTASNPEGAALTTFIVLPTKIVQKDDGTGADIEMEFEFRGWAHGRQMRTVRVPAGEFDGMNWITKCWGFAANFVNGSASTKTKVASIIKEVGFRSAVDENIYTHTGWRKIGGKWCYLHTGGAIGADGVKVEIGEALSGYTLAGEDTDYLSAALQANDALRYVMRNAFYPLIGTVFLAPLREFLSQRGLKPAHILYLDGATQSGKSTVAGLALSFFGNFSAMNLPANFGSTANAIRRMAFALKDMPLVIDDYHPVTNLQDKRRMEGIAQDLVRAFGNNAARMRQRADRSIEEGQPPRSLAIVTGEQIPNVGASGLARLYVVKMNKQKNDTASLDAARTVARNGILKTVMRGYIEWLAKRADKLPDELAEKFARYAERANRDCSTGGGRMSDAVAYITLGYSMYCEYLADIGIYNTDDVHGLVKEAWKTLVFGSNEQAGDLGETAASALFLRDIGTMESSGRVRVVDIELQGNTSVGVVKDLIGFKDRDYYYLIPEAAHGLVKRYHIEQGDTFPIDSTRTLQRYLTEDDCIKLSGTKEARQQKNLATIGVKNSRYWWIPAWKITGDAPPAPKPQEPEYEQGTFLED